MLQNMIWLDFKTQSIDVPATWRLCIPLWYGTSYRRMVYWKIHNTPNALWKLGFPELSICFAGLGFFPFWIELSDRDTLQILYWPVTIILLQNMTNLAKSGLKSAEAGVIWVEQTLASWEPKWLWLTILDRYVTVRGTIDLKVLVDNMHRTDQVVIWCQRTLKCSISLFRFDRRYDGFMRSIYCDEHYRFENNNSIDCEQGETFYGRHTARAKELC